MLYYILAQNTADEDVLERLGSNSVSERALLDALKTSAQRRLAA